MYTRLSHDFSNIQALILEFFPVILDFFCFIESFGKIFVLADFFSFTWQEIYVQRKVHECEWRKRITKFLMRTFTCRFTLIYERTAKRGPLYRSTGQNINGPNINELQINCSTGQQKPVDVQSIILTNMLLRSTAPHVNKYS